MHFRLLKNKTKEHVITTTESNSLKDGGNQCNNIEREDNSAAVITSLSSYNCFNRYCCFFNSHLHEN